MTSGLLPFDVSKHLCVSQELPEVDVEHVTAGLQHDVVVVAVTNSQDVGRHAAAGTRVDEVLHRLNTGSVTLPLECVFSTGVRPGVCTGVCTGVYTLSYCSSVGLCFCSQSASGRSLKDPVTPCSTWIFLRVSA